jgi:ubiquinone biosynthesis protein
MSRDSVPNEAAPPTHESLEARRGRLGRPTRRNPLNERRTEIIRVFAELGFVDLLTRSGMWQYAPAVLKAREAALGAPPEAEQPARLRRALEELGGAFVKLGQMLSVRPDLVPLEYVAELEKLQDAVAPMPFETVRHVVESELECPLEEAYAAFTASPLGSASISQVHAARLHDGTEVVVKVQRPEARTLIDLDLELMARAARALAGSPWAGGADLVAFVSEFSGAVRSELDLTAEARNLDAFGEFFGQEGSVRTPVAFWEQTTTRVLTEGRLDGISLSRPDEIRSSGGDIRRLVRNGVDAYLRMVFELRRFHSDPHPGNLLALEGDAIGFIDFGRVSTLSERALERTADCLVALAHDDASAVTEAVLQITHAGPEADFDELRNEIERMMDRYARADIADTMGQSVLSEVMDITRSHGLHMPSEYAMLFQTFGILQGVVAKLDPETKLLDVAEPYIRRAALRQLPERTGKELLRQIRGYGRFTARLPEALEGVLRQLARGEFGVRFKVDKSDEMLDRTESMVDRVSLTILLSAMGIAFALASGQSALPTWGRFAAQGLLLLVAVAAAWLFWSVASAEHHRRLRKRGEGGR